MLRDEFEQLMRAFRDAGENKKVSLEHIFKESMTFFSHLKDQISSGSPDQRKEAMQMMLELYQEMMKQTQKITEKSGMTSEQLIAFADDPANFSKEQWEALKTSKDQIHKLGEAIVQGLQQTSEQQESLPPPETGQNTPPPKPQEPKKPKDRQTRHSKWMRS